MIYIRTDIVGMAVLPFFILSFLNQKCRVFNSLRAKINMKIIFQHGHNYVESKKIDILTKMFL